MLIQSIFMFISLLGFLILQSVCARDRFSQMSGIGVKLKLLTVLSMVANTVDAKGVMGYEWCAWSEWSACAAASCPNRDSPVGDTEIEEQDVWGDLSSYCVVKPSVRSRRVAENAVVQFTIKGILHTRTPLKRRVRVCRCKFFSILNFLTSSGFNKCIPDSLETNCSACLAGAPIYLNFKDEKYDEPISVCFGSYNGPVRLYEILGGIAGAIVLVIFFAWLIRTLSRVCGRPKPTVTRRRSSGMEPEGRLMRTTPQDRSGLHQHPAGLDDMRRARLPQDESPPAYTDVVSGVPTVQFVDPNFDSDRIRDDENLSEFYRNLHKPSTPSPTFLLPRSDQTSSSNKTLNEPELDGPTAPPPSYQDIVATGQLHGGQLISLNSHVSTGGGGGTDIHGSSNTGNSGCGGGGGGGGTIVDTDLRLASTDP